ncbi:cytochrome c biogenesis protein CcsA [Mesonia maritima]|uniref:Cytochrome c-type biogenesis protein CcsB n=1 Tax=Mesonia maritima TaxID=1793873 RepID=A0ABU1K636_9FLAO|nr:cytochrome c biogenesis protein CcsA [Mesonia maritima]MDR6300715.1 cytochrome c-type biogenesis protein CcsB [Mesonia maritima]
MIQKKIAKFLFSTRLMALLFIVFAVAMAIGTFVENSYTTATAKAWIYNAWWFEAIMVLFAINFAGNINRYKLWKREKWSTLLLHAAFFLIIIGAGVTRYIGYEGIMPIREGEITNKMLSEKTYLTTVIDGEYNDKPLRRSQEHELLLAPGIDNHKTITTDFKGQEVEFEVVKFIEGAEEGLVEDENGKNYLKIVEAGGGNRHDHYLEEGEVSSIHNVLFAYNKPTEGAINIKVTDEGYQISSPFEGTYMRMADRKQGEVTSDSLQPLMMRSLYNMAGMQFVFPDPVVKGKYDMIPSETKQKGQPDGVVVKVSSNGESKTVNLLGAKGIVNNLKPIKVGGLDINLRYGSKEFELPFAIRLKDFIAKKYPGTEDNPTPSYQSFKSKVDLVDNGETTAHEIYMNHILDYEGYRFFQASFDPDEKGTILSVNHDWWGTWITYIGYFLLYLGLMLILFDKGSRFGNLKKQLDKVKSKKAKMLSLLLLLVSFSGFSQDVTSGEINEQHDTIAEVDAHEAHQTLPMQFPKEKIDSVLQKNAISEEHASKFGRLVIQDAGGRMKPANTYSSELLRKISKSDSYEGLNSDQVLFSMTENPSLWYNVPLIYVKAKNDSLHHILGVEEGKKHIPLARFFDATGTYKLSPYLEEAYRAEVKNQFQKDFISADEKVNLLYNALEGKVLKIFPIPNAENNKWLSYMEIRESTGKFKGADSLYVNKILPIYMQVSQTARSTENYEKANEILASIKDYQKKYGAEVMPSDQKINTEILYNKYDVFRGLFWQYMSAGLLMFLFVILQIFYDKKGVRIVVNISKIVILILFILHSAGLIARWYISGHAPWSDAYESMIYVAWATMFFGLAFGRKSDLTFASTAFVTSMILMIAHWNWMDPAIANLVPVLDSYWLMIHVAVIVASYGPFTLGMILGLVSLILMILTNEKNRKKMKLNINELTIITELSLTVGLVMLTIGNFLGGQWANESWGRYWGWDPKETWAIISIMVYAFVIHMRLVPGLRGKFAFNWAAVFAFSSIMMTYFGVNFYLTGLHSYASGDQIISYKFIGIAVVLWLLLGFFANRKYKRFFKK